MAVAREVRVEELVEEVRRLRELVEAMYERLGPVLRVVDELMHLMASEEFFKVVTPAMSAVSAIEKADSNALNAATYASLLCALRGFEKVVKEGIPEVGGMLGMLKLLNDPDVKKLLGLLYAVAKAAAPCLDKELSRFRPS